MCEKRSKTVVVVYTMINDVPNRQRCVTSKSAVIMSRDSHQNLPENLYIMVFGFVFIHPMCSWVELAMTVVHRLFIHANICSIMFVVVVFVDFHLLQINEWIIAHAS